MATGMARVASRLMLLATLFTGTPDFTLALDRHINSKRLHLKMTSGCGHPPPPRTATRAVAVAKKAKQVQVVESEVVQFFKMTAKGVRRRHRLANTCREIWLVSVRVCVPARERTGPTV